MTAWKVCGKRLIKVEESLRKVIKLTPDYTDQDRRMKLIEMELLNVIGVLRYLCQENEQLKQSAPE